MEHSDVPFLYELSYRLESGEGPPVSGEGSARLLKDAVEINSIDGRTLTIPFRDILLAEAGDYRIRLTLTRGKMEIGQLGYHYEEFAGILLKMRNELAKEDLLMHEKLLYTAEDIQYSHMDQNLKVISGGSCEAQVSETSLILAIPDTQPIKFPLSYVQKVEDVDYSLIITMEFGESLCLSMLGRQREPLLVNLEKAMKRLEEEALILCKELFSGVKGVSAETFAPLFKDGRAVCKANLDALSPCLWENMKNKLEECKIGYSYEALKDLGDENACVIGIKRGLMGELTGEYVWFMMPVHNKTILAMEAGMTDGSGGQATYFFSIPVDVNSPERLNKWINLINYCFYMVNFRREPVYLDEEQLKKPAYSQYRFAIEKLPALQLLRSHFLGRALHTTEDGWKKAVDAILMKQSD